MSWRPDAPFNRLPLLPPRADVETKAVLKATVEARAALAGLDQAVRRIPNPTVLVNSLPVLEAQASSEIENIVTTTDDLFRYLDQDSDSSAPAVRETLRYRTALFHGVWGLETRPLSVTTAIEVCSIIHSREMRIRALAGTFIGNPITGEVVYTPPAGESLLRDKLSNWQKLNHSSSGIDPLVVLAVSHYQFEAIHPFSDGNGRTGRILNVLLLVEAGILSQPILYLSRYLIENRAEYYRLLLQVTSAGAWEDWVLFILEGLRQTAVESLKKIDAITVLQDHVLGRIRELTTGGSNADLLAVLFEQPYCRISNVVARCGVSRPTATSWLNALVSGGVLHDLKAGRSRIFINSAFVRLLSDD
jgi:Fic family protein